MANEGVNGQMAVPSNILPQFYAASARLQMFEEQPMYLNIDHQVEKKEFEKNMPFKALHVRARPQILTDGLDKPLDWTKSGREIPALEWHKMLDDPQAVVCEYIDRGCV